MLCCSEIPKTRLIQAPLSFHPTTLRAQTTLPRLLAMSAVAKFRAPFCGSNTSPEATSMMHRICQRSSATSQCGLHRCAAPIIVAEVAPTHRHRLAVRRGNGMTCRAGAAVLEAPSWTQIEEGSGQDVLQGFTMRPGQAPSTAPHPTLPTERHVQSNKPVTLYRDTNAWCPFCERVWMALLEKEIPFDVVFIQLYNKPEWYEEVVPTKLVPAVVIRSGDGQKVVYESYDILKALDEAFPERPLFPSDTDLLKQGEELVALTDTLSKAGYSFLLGREGGFGPGERDESRVPEFQAAFEERLAATERALSRNGGPFFFGRELSYVDLMFMPSLERFAAQLPLVRGLPLRGSQQYPRLSAWFDSLDVRPAYQQVKSDDKTHHLLVQKIFQLDFTAPRSPVDDATQRARREAAAKLNVNRSVIVRDCATRSGVSAASDDEQPAEPPQEVVDAVDFALRRMANYLLTGCVGPKHEEAQGRAIGAATLSYFRNRASSPRDMSALAASEMRAACDAVLQETY